MTHLIINQNVSTRRQYLIEKINEYLDTKFEKFSQLHGNPDIHIIEFTESESIKIEDVKQLQKELIFQPFKERYQIGIICYAHNMTTEAQNAMLKSLEEQGERTIYFLLANSDGSLLKTIVSRCVRHYVRGEISSAPPKSAIRKEYMDNLLSTDLSRTLSTLEDSEENYTALLKHIDSCLRKSITNPKQADSVENSLVLYQMLSRVSTALSTNSSSKLQIENLLFKYKLLQK